MYRSRGKSALNCAKSHIFRTKLKIPHEQIDECDIETLIPKLAGATWLNHYLESLPNLEAYKQMCRQVISMRRSTAGICYTGMFDRGSLVRHSMHRDRRDRAHQNVPPFNLGITTIHTLRRSRSKRPISRRLKPASPRCLPFHPRFPCMDPSDRYIPSRHEREAHAWHVGIRYLSENGTAQPLSIDP